MLDNLSKYKIILASNSPRRQELLREMGVKFDVVVKDGVDESFPDDMKAKNVPEYLAIKKASVYDRELSKGNILLITADTVVISDKQILGKPRDAAEAKAMLRSLQGKIHNVISGVAITTATMQFSFSVKTKVSIRTLTDDLIDYYVDNYMPTDKAGSYGIQEWIGLVAVDYIEGSYHNVMGLPTQRLFLELSNIQ